MKNKIVIAKKYTEDYTCISPFIYKSESDNNYIDSYDDRIKLQKLKIRKSIKSANITSSNTFYSKVFDNHRQNIIINSANFRYKFENNKKSYNIKKVDTVPKNDKFTWLRISCNTICKNKQLSTKQFNDLLFKKELVSQFTLKNSKKIQDNSQNNFISRYKNFVTSIKGDISKNKQKNRSYTQLNNINSTLKPSSISHLYDSKIYSKYQDCSISVEFDKNTSNFEKPYLSSNFNKYESREDPNKNLNSDNVYDSKMFNNQCKSDCKVNYLVRNEFDKLSSFELDEENIHESKNEFIKINSKERNRVASDFCTKRNKVTENFQNQLNKKFNSLKINSDDIKNQSICNKKDEQIASNDILEKAKFGFNFKNLIKESNNNDQKRTSKGTLISMIKGTHFSPFKVNKAVKNNGSIHKQTNLIESLFEHVQEVQEDEETIKMGDYFKTFLGKKLSTTIMNLK